MKWEKYKLLHAEEREEWNFRFKTKLDNPPNNNFLIWLVLFWSNLLTFAAIALVILKEYVSVKYSVLTVFVQAGQITNILVLAFAAHYLGEWIVYAICWYKAHKWYKGKIEAKR